MWKEKTLLMDEKAIGRAIRRIAHEIIERNKGLDKTVLVGIHTRGVPLAQRLGRELAAIEGRDVPVYDLDISAYRDDDRKSPIAVSDAGKSDADGQTVILVDDVLFTGRTVRVSPQCHHGTGAASVHRTGCPRRPGSPGTADPCRLCRQKCADVAKEDGFIQLKETDSCDRVVLREQN